MPKSKVRKAHIIVQNFLPKKIYIPNVTACK